jgi:aconitase A
MRLAGTVHIDLPDQPIGKDKNGKPVFPQGPVALARGSERGRRQGDHEGDVRDRVLIPLEFMPGETLASLGLTGRRLHDPRLDKLAPKARLGVEATSPDGKMKIFTVTSRVDDPTDLEYVRQGGNPSPGAPRADRDDQIDPRAQPHGRAQG